MSDTNNQVEGSTAHNVVQAGNIGVFITDAHGPVHTGTGDLIVHNSPAEAAGIIPEPSSTEPLLDEQVRDWCFRAAISQFDATHGNPALWDPTPQDTEDINALAEQLIARHGKALAAHLQANPAALAVTDDYEHGILALLADPETRKADK
ncbi:hypothetical protein ACIG63_45735 [Streptomyces antimycoticus]|uniref:hypothetical protein n=1 Tax=Streptomyces antimycoticus TaxID=68175 RepID=UPI0037CDECB1